MAFVVGDPVVLTNTFTVLGVATDPTTVSLAVTDPAGTTVTYTWAGATITRTSAGLFTKTITAALPGDWYYVWTGTGAAADVADGTFNVANSGVARQSLTDIITLAEARAAINMHTSDTSQDAEIAAYVTAASRRLDQVVGPVVVRTITAEPHDGGREYVQLFRPPVSSITTVTEYVETTPTVLTAEAVGVATTASNYVLDARYGILTRRSGGTDVAWSYGRSRVIVTYVAGRAANTAAVDPLFKTACTVLLAHWWRREQGSDPITSYQRSHGLAIPRVVKEMLADEWRLPAMV